MSLSKEDIWTRTEGRHAKRQGEETHSQVQAKEGQGPSGARTDASPQPSRTLPTPSFLTSSLWCFEGKHSCRLSRQVCGIIGAAKYDSSQQGGAWLRWVRCLSAHSRSPLPAEPEDRSRGHRRKPAGCCWGMRPGAILLCPSICPSTGSLPTLQGATQIQAALGETPRPAPGGWAHH